MDNSSNNKRIAKNTLALYVRMLFTVIVGLYTSRVVIQTLGVEDYGIYGVVGGIVSMMVFLNSSMSGATSRFITFELGRGDAKRLSDTFSSAMVVHILIALIIVVLAETVGLWFLCNKLVIPENRMLAAHLVYQFSVFSVVFGVTQVPYNSSIIAHEKMDVYAYVEILNVVLKLLIVYMLLIGDFDKLILYAALMLAVSLFIMMVYRIYCIRHFEECRFHWIWNKEYIYPMLSFSGWNLYYEGACAVRQQGANILLNMFCGLVYNAASGIATTVQGVVMGFSANTTVAFRPQIIKAYASQNYDNMNRLIRLGTKFACVLILAFTIPLIFKLNYILALWLGDVPEGAVFMLQCLLIVNVINTSSVLLVVGIQSTGRLKLYSGLCGSLLLLSVGIMYVMMLLHYDYRAIYSVILGTAFVVNLAYAIILKKQMTAFAFIEYYIEVILPVVIISILAVVSLLYVRCYFADTLISLFFFVLFSVIWISIMSFYIVLGKSERRYVIDLVNNKILKRIFR